MSQAVVVNAGDIRIRQAGPADTGWITALAPRLHEFGPPSWHDVGVMNESVSARRLYERVGYRVEWTRMLKRVGPSGDAS